MFLYFICILFNLQMCQIILPDPVFADIKKPNALAWVMKKIHVWGHILWGLRESRLKKFREKTGVCSLQLYTNIRFRCFVV